MGVAVAPVDIYTPIDSDTPPHSISVRTFANCPKPAKFAKVFTRESFPLYGIQYRTFHSEELLVSQLKKAKRPVLYGFGYVV